MTYGVSINYLAVIVTAIVGYFIGFLWYGPIFGKTWMKLIGMTDKDLKKAKEKSMAGRIITGFVAALILTFVLAIFVGVVNATTFLQGISLGFWIWLGFLATTMLGIVLWDNKPLNLYILNTLHYLVVLAVSGGILAVWR